MSWSMLEPEEPPICECKYDEARDGMDRDDCPFHCDLPPETPAVGELEEIEGPPSMKPKSGAVAKIDVDAAA
jgi:hypothetical protein